MTRIRALAKELAEGVWGANIYYFRGEISDEQVQNCPESRWNNEYPNIELLVSSGYLQSGQISIYITKAAFDLLVLARMKAEGLDAFLDLSITPSNN